MGYSLLGAHVNATASGIPELFSEWQPPLVVLLDHSSVWHDVKAASPDTTFVGRVYQEFEPNFNDPDFAPREVAREHCDSVLPWAERMGETCRYWQGVNEPIVSSSEAMKRFTEFEIERTRIMAAEGFRVVVGTFSVGNPELYFWNYFVPALEVAQQHGGALALHQYAWPTMDENPDWLALRHRKVYEGDEDHLWDGMPAHLKSLPLLITECGLDGLVEPGRPPRGWRTLYRRDPTEYLRQLAWYDAELQKDPYVVGAAIYCCGVADATWRSYDIWPTVAYALARKATPLYRLPAPQPQQPVRSDPLVLHSSRWRFETEFRPGPRIIAGSLPRAGIEITLTDPWGNSSTTISGSKPEHGVGGFEFLAPHPATYTLSFQGESFKIKTGEGVSFVIFTEVESAPPPAVPEPRPPTPGDRPEEPSAPIEPPPEVPDQDLLLDVVLERLDRIIEALRERL